MALAPGVGEEDFLLLVVVADDEPHVSAPRLRVHALLGEDAESHAPEDGDAGIHLLANASGELLEPRVLLPHAVDDLRIHRLADLVDVDHVASRKLRHRQLRLLLDLRRLVVLLDLVLEVADAGGHGDDGLIAQPLLLSDGPHDLPHRVDARTALGRRSCQLRDLVLVDRVAIVAEHALRHRRGAIALLSLVHHRHVIDVDVAVRTLRDVVLDLRLARLPGRPLRQRADLRLDRALGRQREPQVVDAPVLLRIRRGESPDELGRRIGLCERAAIAHRAVRLGRLLGLRLVRRINLLGDLGDRLLQRGDVHRLVLRIPAVVERQLHAQDLLVLAALVEVDFRLPDLEPVPRTGVVLQAVDDVAVFAREGETLLRMLDSEEFGLPRPRFLVREERAQIERGQQNQRRCAHGTKSILLCLKSTLATWTFIRSPMCQLPPP